MNMQMESVLPNGFVLEKEQNIMHGTYRGITFLIVPMEAENQYHIQIYADIEKNPNKDTFLRSFSSIGQKYSFIHHTSYNGSNMASVYVVSGGQDDKANLMTAIAAAASECEMYEIHNCCAHCKNVVPLRAAAADNVPLLICDSCFSQMMNRTGSTAVRKENPLLGIIGAVFGVLIGSALWIAIAQIGFIAGIAGLAIIFCGMKGYEILGGKISKKGIVICIVLSCLVILGAEFVSIAIAVYGEMNKLYELTFTEALSWLPEVIQRPEVIAGIIKDLAVGYGLTIWASFAKLKNVWRQVGEAPAQHHIVRF